MCNVNCVRASIVVMQMTPPKHILFAPSSSGMSTDERFRYMCTERVPACVTFVVCAAAVYL